MNRDTGTKEELISAGIHELQEKGFNDFSIRRVAAACGISCAAPYRHFKNKDEFVLAIFAYINRKWYLMQNMILSEYDNARERLTEMSVAYVRFLIENPDYFTILITRSEAFDGEIKYKKNGVSTCVQGLIEQYCNEVDMSPADRKRKTYVVRSLIVGAAYMIRNGELEESEAIYDMIRASISREFEIK
jgi:AcrR family transcriptional regulator